MVTSPPRLSSSQQGSQVPPLVPFTTISPNSCTSNHSCNQESTRHRQLNFLAEYATVVNKFPSIASGSLILGCIFPPAQLHAPLPQLSKTTTQGCTRAAAYPDVQTRQRQSLQLFAYESRGRISPELIPQYHTARSSPREVIVQLDKRYTRTVEPPFSYQRAEPDDRLPEED